MPLPFTKVEGLGNDFVLVDLRADGPACAPDLDSLRARAPQLCDRRRGVGGDGLLLVTASEIAEAEAAMVVINFDGSRPEMCGNGLRCVAAHVGARAGLVAGARLAIETDAGLLGCELETLATVDGPFFAEVRVDMGPAERRGETTLEGRRFVDVSMGNPHAICFVEADPDIDELRTLGPLVEDHPAYAPARTNVEFARVVGPERIILWVWERGVGLTQACGTGACATAVAAADAGLVAYDRPVEVRLPGGKLTIVVPSDRSQGVRMAGPAREVFRGTVE